MLFWPILIIGLAIIALLLSGAPADGIADSSQTDMRMVYLALLAAVLATAYAGRIILRGGHKTLLHTAVWIGSIAGLVTAFAFRDQAATVIHEIRAELMPSVALSRSAGTAEYRRDWDGHYKAEAEVNGVVLELMIDTGASMVLIPHDQAAAIGINLETLEYSMPVITANGRSSVAPVMLSSIKVGSIAVFDVPAAVALPGRLKTGLLGMSFLDKLDEVSFQGNRLILRQGRTDEEGGFQSIITGD
jgi:aspartyl protease family protein